MVSDIRNSIVIGRYPDLVINSDGENAPTIIISTQCRDFAYPISHIYPCEDVAYSHLPGRSCSTLGHLSLAGVILPASIYNGTNEGRFAGRHDPSKGFLISIS